MKETADNEKQRVEPYTEISVVYDYLLRHVDYERWYRYIRELIFRYLRDPQTVLELGCGTGRFGAKFSRDDFTIVGMDKSPEMLRVARARAFSNFHIFCGDITNFHLARPFDFVFSVHDTMNYLLEYRDIMKALRCVHDVMHRESIFMFDLTTEYNILRYFDNQTKKYRHRGADISWDNRYDAKKKLIYSMISVKKDDGPVLTETHVQRIYDIDEIRPLLADAGFRLVDLFSDYSFSPPGEKTIMVNYVVQRLE